MQCENCGQTWTGPGYDNAICPSCGEQPYRSQPTPLRSDMEVRNEGENGGNPLQEGIWAGIDGGWKNRMVRDESFASVHAAFDDDEDDFNFGDIDLENEVQPYTPFNPEEHTSGIEERFIVGPNGEVLRGSNPGPKEFHEHIAKEHGLDKLNESGSPEFVSGPYSLGEARTNGTLTFPQHNSGHDLGAMIGLVSQHYPRHTVDPSLAEASNEERWGLPQTTNPWYEKVDPNFDQKQQQQQQAEQYRGKPFGYYDNPFFNRGGSSMDDHTAIYLPWSLDTEKIAADFDVVQIIPDGFHTIETEDGLVLQHEDPEKLEEAVERVAGFGGFMKNHWSDLALAGATFVPGLGEAAWAAKGASLAARLGGGALGKRLIGQALGKAVAKGAAGGVAGQAGKMTARQMGGKALKGLGWEAVKGATRGGVNRMMNGGGGPGGVGQMGPAPVVPTQYLSFHEQLLAAFDHPSSDDNFTERASGDPDDVDPKEFNDGEGGLAKDDTSPGGTDGLHPEVADALQKAIPSIEHYMDSDDSGQDDPTIKSLLEAIAQHDPQFYDFPDDEDDDEIADLLDQVHAGPPDNLAPGQDKEPSAIGPKSDHSLGHVSATPQQMALNALQPMGQPAQTPMQAPAGPGAGQQMDPNSQALCQFCGARMTGGEGLCPQCGASQAISTPGGPQTGLAPTMAYTEPETHPQEHTFPGDPVSDPTLDDAGLAEYAQRPDLTDAQRRALAVILSLRAQNVDMAQARQRANQYLYPHTGANQGPHNIEQIQAVADYLQEQGRQDEIPNLIAHPEMYTAEMAIVTQRQPPPAPDPDPGVPPPMPDPTQMGMPPGAMPGGGGGMPPPMAKAGAADNVARKCPKCDSHTTGLISDEGSMQCSNCNHAWKQEVEMANRTSALAEELHPNFQGVPAADQVAPDDPQQDINPGAWQTNDGQPLRVGQEYEMYSASYDVPDRVRLTAIKPESIEYTLTGEYGLEHRTEVTKQEAQMDGLSFTPAAGDGGDETANQDNTGSYPGAADPAQQTSLAHTGSLPEGYGLSDFHSPEEQKMQSEPGGGTAAPAQCPRCHATMKARLGACPHCGFLVNHRTFASVIAGKKYTPMQQREFIDEPGEARNRDKLNLAGTHYEEQPGLSEDDFLFGL